MSQPTTQPDNSWRWPVYAMVVLASGFWGFVITFSDYPSAWSHARWIAYIVASHVPGALIAGMLLPSRRLAAMGVAWGAGLLMLMGGMWIPLLMLLIATAIAGQLGGWVARSLPRLRRSRVAGGENAG